MHANSDVPSKIKETGQFDSDTEEALKAAVEKFRSGFVSSQGVLDSEVNIPDEVSEAERDNEKLVVDRHNKKDKKD